MDSWTSNRWLPTHPPVRLPSLNSSPTSEPVGDHWLLSSQADKYASNGSLNLPTSPDTFREHLQQLEQYRQQCCSGSASGSCFSMTSSVCSENGLPDDQPMASAEDQRPQHQVREFSRPDLLAINAETRRLEQRNAELKREAVDATTV